MYRARDTRLSRDVAIKLLPPEFADDPERLARFRREAQTLASLNHPNIAAIYGLEEVDGAPYLVLELVDGETLAARLTHAALSPREALSLGGQIAAAIEAAHERGIVHRDLKPGNVMLTPGGTAKVLDFGLAKSDVALGDAGDSTTSPTVTAAIGATAHGVILGTAHEYFARQLEVATRAGVRKIFLDPGLGFYYRNLQDSAVRVRHQMKVFLNTFRLRTLGFPTCHALPHAFEFFGEEVRCAELFFAVLAALGKTDLFRTHEVPRIKAVLDTMRVY